MVNGTKWKYISFSIPVIFISSIIIILSHIPNLVYTQNADNIFSTYQNSTYDITIKYPHNWDIDESGGIENTDADIVTFSSPNQNDTATVDIHQDLPENGTRGISGYLMSEISIYKNNLNNFKVIESSIGNSLTGNNAYKLIYTYTNEDGSKMKDMEIGTLIGNKIYYIAYDVEEPIFDSYLPIVQNMIGSFKVTIR
jgi:hypothetical protein